MGEYLRSSANNTILTLLLSVLGLICLIWQFFAWKKLRQDKTRVDLALYLVAWVLCIVFVILL